MNKSSLGSTMFSYLMAFALLLEASGHMHDVITGLATTPDGEWLFVRSRFWLMRSQDKGNSFKALRNPNDINWEEETTAGPPNFVLSPDFKNDTTLLFGWYLSTDAGESWSTNLKEALTKKKRRGSKYEICPGDPNPVIFSPDFANDNTIFIVARKEEEPTIATLFYSKDLGENFKFVRGAIEFEIGSWCPVLTAIPGEIYLHRTSGLTSEIFVPKRDPTKWKKQFYKENFEIQSIARDYSTGANILIERNSQTLYRLNLKKKQSKIKLKPIALPNAKTEVSGNELLIKAYSHKGVGDDTSLIVLRSTCPGRELRRFGIECPSNPGIEDKYQQDYVMLSLDEGSSWKNKTIVDWFYYQGGYESTYFKLPEFSMVLGIPGTSTMFLGTFTGLYRSEDNGESWIELDTIAMDVIGMNVGKVSSGVAQLSACTYDASCFSGAVEIGKLRDGSISTIPEGSLEQVVRPWSDVGENETIGIFAYNTLAYSDGIGFLSDKIGVMRYADGLNGTNTRVDSIEFAKKANVHGIRFSPDFENDNTVFVAGNELGVLRSENRGLDFTTVFNTTENPDVPDGCDPVQLMVSLDYASDGLLVAYVTDGKKRKKSIVFVSEDSGATWAAQDQGKKPQRMVSLQLALDNANDEYALLGVQDNGSVWVSRRKGKDKQFAEWENLRFLVDGEYVTELPEAKEGFCHDSLVGAPNGNLYMSPLGGGIVYGKLKGTRLTDVKTRGQTERFRFGGTGQILEKNFRKTYFEGLVEIEGIFFGAFFNEIWMSLDEGETWTSVYTLEGREPEFSGCTKICCTLECVLEPFD